MFARGVSWNTTFANNNAEEERVASFGFGREVRRADIAAEMAARRALMGIDGMENATPPDTLAAADGEEAHGPGWHESSWELRRGLDVREGIPPDLSLAEWRGLWA